MTKLPETQSWLYDMFMEHGFHLVWRSGTYWADLLLEQTMMQSFKSQGGLIRGSKFEESVRVVWAFIEYASMSQHTFG